MEKRNGSGGPNSRFPGGEMTKAFVVFGALVPPLSDGQEHLLIRETGRSYKKVWGQPSRPTLHLSDLKRPTKPDV